MRSLPVSIRQTLDLVNIPDPSLEAIHQAAAAKGLHFDPHSMTLTTPEGLPFLQPNPLTARRNAAIRALQQLSTSAPPPHNP